MSTHIGTKIINAKPMTRQAYNDLRGWTVPSNENPADEGYLVEYLDGGTPNLAGFKGYVSWSPNDVFERAYRPMDRMTFGDALVALKAGRRVAREGWNGKGMWLSLSGPGVRDVPAGGFWSVNNADYARSQGGTAKVLPCITMKTATGEILMGWLASQTDMLAEDWVDLDAVPVPEHKVYSWRDVERHELANDWMMDQLKYRVTMKDGAQFTGSVNTHNMAHEDRPAVARAIVDDINRQVREAADKP